MTYRPAALFFCLVGTIPAYAQSRIDILQIYQNFIASAVAEKACGIESGFDSKFLANLTTVTIRAAQRVKEQNLQYSEGQLKTVFASVDDHIHKAVDSEVQAHGCPSARIQQLLKLYQMHAAMNLGG